MSSRDMTINQIKAVDKDFGAKHTISVKGFNDNGRTTTRDLILSIRDELIRAINNLDVKLNARIDDVEKSINARIDDVEKSINARIDKLEARIDNLVKINNLKE